MVFFLYAVSGLLVLGGFGLALYGADNIRSDSGAVFAATGVSAAAAGLLLLATTRVLTELRKIRVALEDGMARAATGVAMPGGPVAAGPVAPPPPSVEPTIAPPRPALDMNEAQRELDLAPPAGAMAASAAAAAGAAVAGGLAEQLLQRTRRRIGDEDEPAEAAHDTPREAVQPAAAGEAIVRQPAIDEDDDLLRHIDAVAPAAPVPVAPEPVPAAADTDAPSVFADVLAEETAHAGAGASDLPPPPSAVAQEEAPPPQRAERTLAATYASGDNTYFMYSDGTIEAETPMGRFRFVSMDELRVFVETGEGGIPLSPAAPPGAA